MPPHNREFFQCDFDIAGSYASMVADAEVLKVRREGKTMRNAACTSDLLNERHGSLTSVQVLVEILLDLSLGTFEVKLNHRGLLDAMLEIAGERG